jgi:hypothetical protein
MRISLLCVLAVGACGGDGGGSGHEGIYMVDTWTRNATACDAEGPSIAATNDPLFYLKNESFFGQTFVNVKDCTDVDNCKMLANDKDTVHIGNFGFDMGSDSSGWTTHSAFGFAFQGQCEGDVHDSKLTFTGTTLRIESRSVAAKPFPAGTNADDECPDEKVEQNAAGQPCTELEVLTATFMSKF